MIKSKILKHSEKCNILQTGEKWFKGLPISYIRKNWGQKIVDGHLGSADREKGKKNCQPRILYSVKNIQVWKQNKDFSHERRLRKFVISRPAPQECRRIIVSLKRNDSKWKHLGRNKEHQKWYISINFFQTYMTIQSKIINCLVFITLSCIYNM